MTLPTYIIHLDRATARLQHAVSLRTALGEGAQIVPAVDAMQLGPEALADALGPRCRPWYPFALRPAEIATFMSHRSCWQRLLDEGHAAALIVEDDIEIEPAFSVACDLALQHASANSFVRLPGKNREAGYVMATQGAAKIIRPRLVGLGMLAQIVTAGAARRLLSATEHFDRPVDTFLQLSWRHGVDMLSVWPSGVSEISASIGGSTIHRRETMVGKLKHELLRPLYRLSINYHSLRHRNDP